MCNCNNAKIRLNIFVIADRVPNLHKLLLNKELHISNHLALFVTWKQSIQAKWNDEIQNPYELLHFPVKIKWIIHKMLAQFIGCMEDLHNMHYFSHYKIATPLLMMQKQKQSVAATTHFPNFFKEKWIILHKNKHSGILSMPKKFNLQVLQIIIQELHIAQLSWDEKLFWKFHEQCLPFQ